MSERRDRAKAKGELASELALTGAAVGSVFGPTGAVIGGATGGLTGLIIADSGYVFPIDFIAIPAYQAHLISGTASTQVYIKAGETLVPTGNSVIDPAELESDMGALTEMLPNTIPPKRRAKGAGLPRKYAKMGFKKGWREYKKTTRLQAKTGPLRKRRKGGKSNAYT